MLRNQVGSAWDQDNENQYFPNEGELNGLDHGDDLLVNTEHLDMEMDIGSHIDPALDARREPSPWVSKHFHPLPSLPEC
jgi:hypothetical protein